MRVTWLPFLLLLAACGGGDVKTPEDGDVDLDTADTGSDDSGDTEDSEDSADTQDSEPPACTATIVSLDPAAGATDIAIDTTVTATFSEAVDAADIELDGVSGTLTLTDGGTRAVFTPDAALDRDTTYTGSVSVCDSVEALEFTTMGEALDLDLTGRTYAVDLTGGDITWNEPSPTLGEFMMGSVDTTHILIGVETATTTELDLVGAAGFDFNGEIRQYPCTYAMDFDPTDFASNPAFDVGPMDAELGTSSMTIDVYEFAIEGVFTSEADELVDVHISGLVDARPISESVGMEVCDLIGSFGGACVTCPDGEVQCIALDVVDASAPWMDGLVLDPALDPTADRYCG